MWRRRRPDGPDRPDARGRGGPCPRFPVGFALVPVTGTPLDQEARPRAYSPLAREYLPWPVQEPRLGVKGTGVEDEATRIERDNLGDRRRAAARWLQRIWHARRRFEHARRRNKFVDPFSRQPTGRQWLHGCGLVRTREPSPGECSRGERRRGRCSIGRQRPLLHVAGQ